jgi:hypothetical protein
MKILAGDAIVSSSRRTVKQLVEYRNARWGI